MKPLRVTARLISPLAVFDDYSPALDGLLEYLYFAREGSDTPNLTRDNVVEAPLPLAKTTIAGESFWACSAPVYVYTKEGIAQYRKRWDPEYTGHVDFGKKSQRWNQGSGDFKSYDKPLFWRLVNRIHWYAIGDKDMVFDLLSDLHAIGKKFAFGFGQLQAESISVIETSYDYHLVGPSGNLMRLLPLRLFKSANDMRLTDSCAIMEHGWKPPARFNREICVCPTGTVRRAF